MIRKTKERTVPLSIAVGFLLLLSACSSNADAVASSSSVAATASTVSADGADLDQNVFVMTAEKSCSETRVAVDGLFVEGGESTMDPQAAVGAIAEHFNQLYDQITAVEGAESEMTGPTETYLGAVLAAAEEATDAQATPEQADAYLAAHSEKLTAVNDAGAVLGVQACSVRFAEDA